MYAVQSHWPALTSPRYLHKPFHQSGLPRRIALRLQQPACPPQQDDDLPASTSEENIVDRVVLPTLWSPVSEARRERAARRRSDRQETAGFLEGSAPCCSEPHQDVPAVLA
jgi:hypothetical protein